MPSFDQKAIYVSHSRARERVDTYVPSKEAFLARAERAQGERLGVLEAIADAKRKNDDPMHSNGFKVGDRVTWNYEARGGYGYVMAVPGVVTKLAAKRVEIAVPSQSKQARTRVGSIALPDSQWIRVTRWVQPERLTPRVASAGEAERVLNGKLEQLSQPAATNTETEMDKIQVRQIADPERDQVQRSASPQADEDRQYLAVPYAEREAAKAAGAKWDWREKLWYSGPEGTRAGLAKWLPENAAAAAPARANPREEFADVLRELGGDLTDEHPIMDGRPQRMAVPRHVVSWDLRQKYFVGKVGQCLAQSRDVSHSFEDRRESALASEALNSGAIRYVQESNPA